MRANYINVSAHCSVGGCSAPDSTIFETGQTKPGANATTQRYQAMKPYRRPDKPGAKYYVQFFHKGRRIQYCTGKTDYHEASTEAMRYAAEVKLGRVARAVPQDGAVTVQMICDRYLAKALHVSKPTRDANVNCLLRIAKVCGYSGESSASILDRALITGFQDASTAAKRSPVAINSVIRQARSLFSKRSLPLYTDLSIPDVSALMAVPLLKEPRTHYVPPPAATISSLSVRANELKDSDPQAYAGFVLAMYTGLRSNEIVHAEWSWVHACAAGFVMEVPAAITKSERPRRIPIDAGAVEALKSVSPGGGPIVPEPMLFRRKQAIQRRLSLWLRENGVKTGKSGKTVHELRKYYGSMIATRHGLFAAQRMLGHANSATTAKHYADLIDLPPPIEMMGAVGG